LALLTGAAIVVSAIALVRARPQAAPGGQGDAGHVAIDADDIGGVVTSTAGPEAGVWVIAETTELGTKYRKIVVTDDRGRYVIPDLPPATYDVWVRGYGLVDSPHVRATPGKLLPLTGVVAPNAVAAAQIYPANYWYSLMQVPPKEAFPIKVAPSAAVGTDSGAGPGGFDPGAKPNFETEGAVARKGPPVIKTQAEWVNLLKCTACHQMGNLATRQLSKNLGTFNSSADHWERALRSGQEGVRMLGGVDRFGHERGLAMFADWSDRIAAGETPAAPPRPQGAERNVVITLWDVSIQTAFVHDAISTDKRNPTVNGYGPVYGVEWGNDAFVWVDPAKNTKHIIPVPVKDEADRASMPWFSPKTNEASSPYWGDELAWRDPASPHTPVMDRQGRVWFNGMTHSPDKQPAFCKDGSSNPFAKVIGIPRNMRGVSYFDPKTGKISVFDTCFYSSHLMFADDKDDTLYFSITHTIGGMGWVKTKQLLETGNEEKAQGWCPPILDYNGDGKIGAYTRAPEPAEPGLDRLIRSEGYGVSVNPADGSVWYVSPGVPGFIARMTPGTNPPATCTTEVYEPPYNNPKVPGAWGSNPRGIDVDRNGVVWTALSTSSQLASFDRRKCKAPLNGPNAMGQHCPEGWTLYNAPGPKFKGMTDDLGADYFYYNWVDQFDTLGLGKNIPVVTGTWSDSLMALDPATKKWTVMRVPYPLGFYARGLDGRIDDPNAGWKGRGLWAAQATRVVWHDEGGKGSTSYMAHFQMRPDPLAK
jgi:hypothetical protein